MRLNPFEHKYERAAKLQREQRQARDARYGDIHPKDDLSPSDFMEKHDMFAMIVAACITILPVTLIVLVLLGAVGYFFIVR